MENEIMNNEEVIVDAAEVVNAEAGNGAKLLVGAALVIGVGFAAYKGIKWVAGKVKAKKAKAEVIEVECDEVDDCDEESIDEDE